MANSRPACDTTLYTPKQCAQQAQAPHTHRRSDAQFAQDAHSYCSSVNPQELDVCFTEVKLRCKLTDEKPTCPVPFSSGFTLQSLPFFQPKHR
jgi:hypothetical protein